MSTSKKAFILKMVLAGDGAVGKTSLRIRYLGHGFQSQYIQTIGADFAVKTDVINGKKVNYAIWDLAGQQHFESVRSAYYMGTLGALLVFDVTRRGSFENLNSWIHEIWKHNGKGVIPIVILGNKHDLRPDIVHCIDEEEAQKYCEELSKKTKGKGFDIKYLNTSAKTGLNVTEAFHALWDAFYGTLKGKHT
ncbi:MAG: GTP-binding protein [Candidatus Odinarchaeota archaeon]